MDRKTRKPEGTHWWKRQERQATPEGDYWWKQVENRASDCQPTPKEGDTCRACHQGKLAYDSLFMLACPRCGHVAESGAFS